MLADLGDPRFSQTAIHHALEELDRHGIRPLREHRTPESILAWIDAEFGGTWSSEAAAGGIWIAQDDRGPIAFAAYDPRGLRFHWLRYWAQKPSVGIFGPCGVAVRARRKGLGTVLVRASLFSLLERGYRQALIPAVRTPESRAFYEAAADARVVENVDLGRRGRRWRATILASGNGGNFAALVDAARASDVPLDIVALVCDKPHARVLERASGAGISACCVAWDRRAETREAYDARVLATVAQTEPELVLLLGWMHVLPATFVARFPEMLNLHPAFLPLDPAADSVTMPDGSTLPAFRGAHAFTDALAARSAWAGASVHRVGVAIDRGEIFARLPLDLREPGDDLARFERLHELERRVVATAVRRWTFEQR
ncbi:MAG: GNAT family N-acetyltransferase [Candidatus Eremiobacteraeota bacterium]|nr:GNAT family N-acetyltransferase [Candidatus Eremiobacteraeota bacterium]